LLSGTLSSYDNASGDDARNSNFVPCFLSNCSNRRRELRRGFRFDGQHEQLVRLGLEGLQHTA
jgi:hypothetical protein